jgi:hypothetical protein
MEKAHNLRIIQVLITIRGTRVKEQSKSTWRNDDKTLHIPCSAKSWFNENLRQRVVGVIKKAK